MGLISKSSTFIVKTLIQAGGVVLSVLLLAHTASANPALTYQGRLLSPDGTPVEASAVHFRVQIRSPLPSDCLMYEAAYSRNMTGSDGLFSISINGETPSTPNSEPFAFHRIFKNQGQLSFAGGKCASGSTYSPAADDPRVLAVFFNIPSSFGGWEPLPRMNVNYVPLALEAVSVGGFKAAELFRVEDGSNAPVVLSPWSQANYQKLLDLVSNVNITGGVVSVGGSSASFSGSLSGDVTGTQSSTSVVRLQGRNIHNAAPSNGDVLTWNQASTRWEAAAPTGGGGGSPTGNAGGDLDGTYPNPTIATNAVTTTKIADANITGAKFQAGSADGQVFRWESGAWAIGKINYMDLVKNGGTSPWPSTACTAGQAVVWTSVNDAFGCATITPSISAGSIDTLELADGAVTTPKIEDDAVTTDKLADAIVNGLWTANSGNVHRMTGNVGIATNNPQAPLHVEGIIRAQQLCDESGGNCKDISDGWGGGGTLSSLNGSSQATQTFSTGTTGTDFGISTNAGTGVHSFNLPDASASARGALTSTDWSAFNSKLGTTLASGNIWVGSLGGTATARALSGAITVDDGGVTSYSGTVPLNRGGTGQTTKTASFNALSPLTTKGDLAAHDGTDSVRLPVGTDTYVLSANSSTATGLEWVALPASSGGDITNGGNSFTAAMTIGTNDAYALNFETDGTTRMSILSTGQTVLNSPLRLPNGSNGTPSLTFTNKTNTGLFLEGTDDAGVAVNGAQVATFTNSYLTTYRRVRQMNDSEAEPGYSFSASSGMGMYNAGTNILGFSTAGSERMRINATGNVGIGTTTPTAKLNVIGSVTISDSTSANGSSAFAGGQYTHADGNQSIAYGSGIAASGDFSAAFGQNSSTYGTGGIALAGANASGNHSVAMGYASTGSGFANTGGNYSIAIGAGTSAGARPYVSGTGSVGIFMGDQGGAAVTANNVMVILGGNVGIGTTNPTNTLHVNGTLRVATLNAATATQVCLDASNVLSSCSSSARYKQNILDLDMSLETILNLRPVSYQWIQSQQHDVGFIAEEVEKVDSRYVTYNKEGQIQGVKYDQLTAPLVKAVQMIYERLMTAITRITQMEEVTTANTNEINILKSKIAEKERKIQSLEERLERLEKSLPKQ